MRKQVLDSEALTLIEEYWDSKPYWIFCIVFRCSKNTIYRTANDLGLIEKRNILKKRVKAKCTTSLEDDLAKAEAAGLSYGKWRARERGALC